MGQKTPKNIKVGLRVRSLRKKMGFTLSELAEKVYVLPENGGKQRTPQHIGYIERGERPLSRDWAALLSKVFNVRQEYLMCEDDFETMEQKTAFPLINKIVERQTKIKAVESFIKEFGLTFEYVVPPELAKYANKKTEDISADELDEIFAFTESHEDQYKLTDNSGHTLLIISRATKQNFIDELCDFFEFKLYRLSKIYGGENGNDQET